MINNVLNFPQLPEVAPVKPVTADPVQEVAPAASADAAKNEAGNAASNGQDQGPPPEYSLRLTVDKDPRTGEWVYKAIDRYTGEVVRQLPRQSLLDMKASKDYQAGSVIKTQI